MTTIKFFHKDSIIIGFESYGHSGYASEGSDIICAAISSAVRLVECTISDVLKIHAITEIDSDEARIFLKLPEKINENEFFACNSILKAFLLYMKELQVENPQYVKVLEV